MVIPQCRSSPQGPRQSVIDYFVNQMMQTQFSVEPMYIAGRLRTASRPSNTAMDDDRKRGVFAVMVFPMSPTLFLTINHNCLCYSIR